MRVTERAEAVDALFGRCCGLVRITVQPGGPREIGERVPASLRGTHQPSDEHSLLEEQRHPALGVLLSACTRVS